MIVNKFKIGDRVVIDKKSYNKWDGKADGGLMDKWTKGTMTIRSTENSSTEAAYRIVEDAKGDRSNGWWWVEKVFRTKVNIEDEQKEGNVNVMEVL